MHRAKKPPLSTLNEHLICHLCKGYFIDATTIIECLHTFCRSCIVKYLETTKYCPVCDVQVHKSKPLLSLRSDRIVQEIVYKLVPRLFHNELQRRKEFNNGKNSGISPELELRNAYPNILSQDEELCVRLNYHRTSCCKPRYFKCPSGVSIMHLQKLIKAKFDLTEMHHIDILYQTECLNPSNTLMDVVYIYKLSRLEPLDFTYRIYEYVVKKLKEETAKVANNNNNNNNNNNWKEVQLRISENGEMSIQTSQNFSQEMMQVLDDVQVELPELEPIKQDVVKILSNETIVPGVGAASATTTTIFTTLNNSKCSVVPPPGTISEGGVKRNAADETPPPNSTKRTKSDEEEAQKTRPGTPKPSPKYSGSKLCYMPKPVITVPKAPLKIVKTATCTNVTSVNAVKTPVVAVPVPKPKVNNTPIGYKTLRDPPKSWNSQISKANVSPKAPDNLKNVRPAKFFKMRNSMPRFLGNPASGVKPMYSVAATVPDKDDRTTPTSPIPGDGIKKHSIVKIDPKTLKPISEKAPEKSSLSKQLDLKINTSSVSIINPLKLQQSGSPKGTERKSPVSPPVLKRDKPNLNFTPPNPFVPNLTSQTVNPNQFLGPPGFPSYDPRVMAAYHNFLYGFPPGTLPYHLTGLASDIRTNKNFDISKLVGGTLAATSTTTATTTTTTPSIVNNKNTTGGGKVVKNEKSLQNAVEKLTLSRTKEIDKLKKIAKNDEEESAKVVKDDNSGKEVVLVKSSPPASPVVATKPEVSVEVTATPKEDERVPETGKSKNDAETKVESEQKTEEKKEESRLEMNKM